MAGYKPLYASEFIEEARNTYKQNHKDVYVDGRDIREVKPQDIIEIIGTSEIDVLEGSPPCASFSLSGKREKGWGEVREYSDTVQRSDDLFFEFARLVEGLQPKVFVAENVKGLVIGSGKGYFKLILARLKKAGYRVEARVLSAAYLGVPQARERVIFVGVRNDLNKQPVFPTPFPYTYAIKEIIKDNPSLIDPETNHNISFVGQAIYPQWLKLGAGKTSKKYFNLMKPDLNKPVPTILATGGIVGTASVTHPVYSRKLNLEEVRLLSGFPADFVLTGSYTKRYERIGRAVPPLMMKAIAETIAKEILNG
jgi:DNA (cytosine-5)-methyltransferase 1